MILLAESGSTKTDWRIIGEEDIQAFETIGLNPYFVNSSNVYTELKPYLNEQTPFKVKEVHFYGTGITDSAKGAVISEGIIEALGYTPHISTYSDVIAAARALFGNNQGLASILGTGSNTCYWGGQEVSFQIPPLGFWLGDEGSGGYLGKMLILGYLHKEMPQEIRNKFETVYGAKDRLEILNHAYQKDKPNRYFAQYCPFLLENINTDYCAAIVESAFKQFFEKYVIKYPQIKTTKLGAVGSVAFYFEKVLNEVAGKYDLSFSKIIQKPIKALEEFHANNR